ncbi:bifunctional riboflavin kinase/FAD synthetase [Aurantibacter sp.]|uniref:bifunctional riboflavin kinase/FAD synthetase n=1 Tax=Aurantibacter sp. TaxID=2807103 RepID=UPI0035C7F3DB
MNFNTKIPQPSVVTIGTFDGVHFGHQKIISRLISVAKTKNLASVLLTFFPHPRMVLQKDSDIKLINTLAEKDHILKGLGLSNLVVNKFTKDFSRLTAEDFVKDILVKQLNAKHVIIGYDHHFGRNRSANITDLKRFGEQFNFTVEEISAQDINEVSVSSTKIRKALLEGDIDIANQYLNYNFMLNGTVIRGKGIGKTIQFPTANIKIYETYKLIPKDGVYVIESTIDNKTVFGMMNIGNNPTVNGISKSIEVHFFDLNEDLYGKDLTIEILKRIRDEKKYESLNELKTQLKKDQKTAKTFIKNVR